MSDTFDPYYIWLGIPSESQPPDHYRLLGVTLFESNREVIEAAANRQMAYMQEISAGDEHIDEAQKILGELSKARVCLLNQEKKKAYDDTLRDSFDLLSEAAEPAVDAKTAAVPTSAPDSVEAPQVGDLGSSPAAVPEVPAVSRRPRKTQTGRKPDRTLMYIGTAVVGVLLLGGIVFLFSSNKAKKEAAHKAQIAKRTAEQKAEEAEQRAAEAKRRAIEEHRKAKQKVQAEAARQAKAKAEREAKAEAERQANAKAEREAKAKSEREANAEAERQAKAKEKADRDAEQAMAERKLKRREQESDDQIVWILEDEQTIEYGELQDQQDSEQIEKLELLHKALLARYAELANDKEIKSYLEQLGGKLATGKDLPFWPDELRDELEQQGLREQPKQEGDDQTVWILEDEQTLLGTLKALESQQADIFALPKKRDGKTEADAAKEKELVEQFTTDWEKAKDSYETVNEKYKSLDTTALKEKTASLGSTLGPTLDERRWKRKLKSFNKVPKRKSKSARKLPEFREWKGPYEFDGNRATRQAKPIPIMPQPSVITAEAVVLVRQGKKDGSFFGQALDNGGIEQGWELGYGRNNFEFRIGTVAPGMGGRYYPVPASKTTLLPQKVCHVVGTYNGFQTRLYINGVLEATKPKKGAIKYPKDARSPLVVGAHQDSDEYIELNGTVHLVRIYAGALDDAQVKSRYNEVRGKIDELNQGR